jgi:hypothetical protein
MIELVLICAVVEVWEKVMFSVWVLHHLTGYQVVTDPRLDAPAMIQPSSSLSYMNQLTLALVAAARSHPHV